MISKMSLKINISVKRIIKWTVCSILVILLLVFFVRVVTWEDAYYREMEGSERAESAYITEDEELVEEKPTEEEVYEYRVPMDRPRYLTIEKLGVYQARIIPVGIKSDGSLGTPNNIFDVGWYDGSDKPGTGGTMLIDGHNGGPNVHGVFKKLPSLVNGDIIIVERGDGVKYRFEVVENKTVALSDSDSYMKIALRSPEAGRESVTLITCTGEWSQAQGTYLSRQFTRAVLVK